MSLPSRLVLGCALAIVCGACPASTPAELSPAEPSPVEPSPVEPSPASGASEPATASTALYPELRTYLDALQPGLDAVPPERREALAELATYVRERRAAGEPARLLFICTHNSRRSHMGQLWAATAAAYYDLDGIETFSGGTEATAFNPRAVAAMQRAGFVIEAKSSPEPGANPRYEVRIADGAPAMLAFSKTWADPSNPSEGFAAVMTCSQADQACPFVRGASLRVALPYEDPKLADDTDAETDRYDERARQIAIEMLYLARLVAESP